VHGFSPLSAGAAMLPMATMMVVMSSRSAPLADRFGRDRVMATGLVFIAGGMLIMSTLTPASSYWTMAVALVFFGTGMALTMAPATGAVMESMPLAKAGVGSAVNDTTREVGGSLGVAVLGSLLSTGYRSHLSPHLAALPAQAAAQARASLGGALKVAALAPRSTGDSLAAAARHAFTDGMSVVFIIAAAIAVLTAALQLVVMPGRRGRVVTYVRPEEDELRAVAGE
jgi:Na+/melibiose symporter-like transporter